MAASAANFADASTIIADVSPPATEDTHAPTGGALVLPSPLAFSSLITAIATITATLTAVAVAHAAPPFVTVPHALLVWLLRGHLHGPAWGPV